MVVLLGPKVNTTSRSRTATERRDELLFVSSRGKALRDLKNNISVEPMMFLQMVGSMCCSVMLQNMYIDRICRIREGYNETICGNLTDKDYIGYESEVDKSAANYIMYRGAIETGFPILFSLFLGPWIDKHRTKPAILLCIVGYIFSSALYLLFTFLPDVPPEYFLLGSIPIALCGGWVALVLSVFSYMAKCTTTENRSYRIGVLEASWYLGGPIGLTIGSQIYKRFSYPGVFIVSTSFYILSFAAGCLFIKEAKPDVVRNERKNVLLELFDIGAVKNVFATIFRPRNGSTRSLILLLILSMCLRLFSWFGASGSAFLFVRRQLNWGYQEYTTFTTIDSIMSMLGNWAMILLTIKIFKMSDTTIGIVSSMAYSVAAIVLAFTYTGWMLYLASAIQMLTGLTTVVIRSMLSKCVVKEELGKVYTFVACCEALTPMLATTVYSTVFRFTIDVFPGAMYFISAIVNIFVFMLFIYFAYIMRKEPPHIQLDDTSI